MHIIYLASTSYSTAESAAPGGGGGGVGGSGGAPARYAYTAGAFLGLSPWNDDKYTYSISQLKLGNNFISNLEVVSSLNLFNQARCLYYFNYLDSPTKYAPKVYLATIQTTGINWIYNYEDSWKNTQKMDWPQNFQVSQKGEAILCFP